MSSPPAASRLAVPRGQFLLLQDEPPLAPKGHGALASLIRHHPAAALASPFGRDVDEAAGGAPEDESARRDERRMSAILNSANMRSMRLIGNSNPRYRWERYWKTEAELAAMPKHMSVAEERPRTFTLPLPLMLIRGLSDALQPRLP